MDTHADRAEAVFAEGYNCAQAVLGAFSQALGLEERTAMRIASSLGGGLGHTGEVCGAALGMMLAIGMAEGYDTADQATKMAHSERVAGMMRAFRERFGATGCDALREVGNRAVCIPYVRYAAELVEQAMRSEA